MSAIIERQDLIFFFNELIEAGIVLKGSEVKSLRDGKASSAGFDWRRLEKYENILIVDDINDSGATLWEVANQIYGRMISKPKFATLVSKETSEFDNLIFGDKINKTEEDDWVVFPWE